MRRVYIVLSTAGVGGAEKRFADHWFSMRQSGLDAHLVLDQRTRDGLAEQEGYASKLADHPNLHVLDFAGSGYRGYCRAVWRFFRGQPRRGLIHFPLAYVPGLCTRFGHSLVVSWVNTEPPPLRPGNWRNGVTAWLSLALADHIDALNPSNTATFRKFLFWKKHISTTHGGSIIDVDRCRAGEKAKKFVYIGRLVDGKQPLRLAETLPTVHSILAESGFSGYQFAILGDGPQAPALRQLVDSSRYDGVPLVTGYTNQPLSELSDAMGFFSVQYTSNYPSRALAEAMACGAYPIVTDVGETRLMTGEIPQAIYVTRDFTADEIAGAIASILRKSFDQRARDAEEISGLAALMFSPAKQTKYFVELYNAILER